MTTTTRPATAPPVVASQKWSPWFAFISVLLLVVGLGAGLFIGRATKADTAPPADLAKTSVTAMLTDLTNAVNAGDATQIATFYATDATMTTVAPAPFGWTVTGNTKIADTLQGLQRNTAFSIGDVGTAIQRGSMVAQATTWSGASGLVVYELGTDGKIVNQWVIGK